MVTKKPKGLGRGLEALLGPKVSEAEQAAASGQQANLPSSLALSNSDRWLSASLGWTMTLARPVSSSSVRKTTPLALPGR